MIRAYVANSLAQAHLIKGFLDAEGIFALVRGEHLVGIAGEIPITMDTLPSIWVGEDDRDRARALIDEALKNELVFEDWTCPECGETVEGQFTECWQCGSDRTPVV
ncbi:MAG TPA: DUF2007 domain-containing protein [Actinomycetota bacterium]|nr:DUF2007 domain-containing protein [Actinomycetota bacterium]